MGRDIDEILNAVNDVVASENKIAQVKERLKDTSLTTDDRAKYEKMLEQLDTEWVLKKEVMQDAFSKEITTSYNEKDRVNTALADLGSRYVRLELTEDRLGSQKGDFEDLMSRNEEVDLEETIIKYGSADVVYKASLYAASRAVQNTLLDFLR
jgi:flagellar hook-associated protein 3 FlgL